GHTASESPRAEDSRESASPACPRCRSLEARIAALEAELAAARGEVHGAPTAPATDRPPLEFRALRLVPYGWGQGWALRPSPVRRRWMDELPQSYQCLPLIIANQWGW